MTLNAVIRRGCGALCWAAATLACVATPTDPAGKPEAAALVPALERSVPLDLGPRERELAALAGDWVVHQVTLPEAGPRHSAAGGTAHLAPLLGGRVLRFQLSFDLGKGAVESLGLLTYDRDRERYQLVWASQAASGMRTAEGAGRLDGEGIVLRSPDGSRTLLRLEGERLTFESAPPGADSALLRTVYERRPPD